MPMRGELSIVALRTDWLGQADEPRSRPAVKIFRNPDFVAVAAFSIIGLLAWAVLAVLFPFSDEVATLLAQVF